MLVLSRKLNERIIIGDHVEIAILGITPEKVKIGIKAPSLISVHRKEVYDMISAQNLAASSMSVESLEKAVQAIGGAQKG